MSLGHRPLASAPLAGRVSTATNETVAEASGAATALALFGSLAEANGSGTAAAISFVAAVPKLYIVRSAMRF